MAEANDMYGSIYQNLLDACDRQTADQCMMLVKESQFTDMLQILTRYRKTLLGFLILIRPLAGRAAARYETQRIGAVG